MRTLLSSPSPPSHHSHNHHLLLLLLITTSIALSLIIVLLLIFYLLRSLRRSPTLPLPSSPPPLRRFSFHSLRTATHHFHPHLSLGRGASAHVFRAQLLPENQHVAVKRLLDSSNDQEFLNELHILSSLRPSPFIVSLVGYCLEDKRRRRRLLVYEYMPNGSLQEALFGSSEDLTEAVLSWERRFSIVLDVARALEFLHLECDPPVVHGDIKPSNVLLGEDFRAKISDFGLSRVKEAEAVPEFFSQDLGPGQDAWKSQDFNQKEDFAFTAARTSNYGRSPRGKEVGASPVQDEVFSIEHSKEFEDARTESSGQWGKEWWWKQEGSGELTSKDYVREWIGSQIGPSGNPDWDGARKNSPEKLIEVLQSGSRRVENLDAADGGFVAITIDKKNEKKQEKKKLGGGGVASFKSDKKMREWWKEEYFAEISNKNGSKKEKKWFRTASNRGKEFTTNNAFESGSKRHRDFNGDVTFKRGWKKKRSQSVGSDMFSGDLFSRELSSTTSMRGTVCYVAPECHGGDFLMEKTDIYSFGVLILVIVSGRRPLHVSSSPRKLEKANLVSWCRQLAQAGNVLDIVDEKLKDSFNKDQAMLCISLALLCLQRMPDLRPDSGDIVKFLKGEMELPTVPCEFSPSPPGKHSAKSRRKPKADAD